MAYGHACCRHRDRAGSVVNVYCIPCSERRRQIQPKIFRAQVDGNYVGNWRDFSYPVCSVYLGEVGGRSVSRLVLRSAWVVGGIRWISGIFDGHLVSPMCFYSHYHSKNLFYKTYFQIWLPLVAIHFKRFFRSEESFSCRISFPCSSLATACLHATRLVGCNT